jgi:hypothetical protein
MLEDVFCSLNRLHHWSKDTAPLFVYRILMHIKYLSRIHCSIIGPAFFLVTSICIGGVSPVRDTVIARWM